jgi:diguanylate cyclase (GGDEF)-like protein/PAS domain S-box-containing protein
VDDNPAIHDDFRKVLCPASATTQALLDASAALFGAPAAAAPTAVYEVDAAGRGQDGAALLERALAEHRPYALAFVDMRMPNGWNGLQTTKALWALDPDLQVVLCTAFSDFSWDEIRAELPRSDRFLILKKPFDNIEVQQLAAALTERHLTELALAERERRLAEAQHVARIGHYTWHARRGEWSHAPLIDDLFGVAAQGSPERWLSCIDAADSRTLQDVMELARLQGGSFEQFCGIHRGDDGTRRWLVARGHWESDADGQPLRLNGSMQDVTPLYAAQEQQRLLEASMARINDLVLIVDASDPARSPRTVYVNEAFLRRTGYSREQALGGSARMLCGPLTDLQEVQHVVSTSRAGLAIRSELLLYTAAQEAMWLDVDVVPVIGEGGRSMHLVAAMRDISSQKATQARIEHLAYYDALTALPNRRLLVDRLQQQIAACARKPTHCGLLFIDLDNFKEVNDQLGHEGGDQLLVEVAQRLSHCVREEDTVARLGGDEFVVLLKNLGLDADVAARHAQRIAVKITQALVVDPPGMSGRGITASVGITLFGVAPSTADELLRHADVAMYQAKSAGKNSHAFFDPGWQIASHEADYLGQQLRHAAERGQLSLKFQPQFDALARMVGAEALLRWDCPGRGQVPPAIFLPLAEQCDAMARIGDWVLDHACLELARWAGQPGLAGLRLALNMNAAQYLADGFVEQLQAAMQSHGVRPGRLLIELGNDVLAHDPARVSAVNRRLAALGVAIGLDDHGDAAHRPLTQLQALAPAQIKIDIQLVRALPHSPQALGQVRAIVERAHELGVPVAAEGVETQAQQRLLDELGCSQFQGYLYCRPVNPADLLACVTATPSEFDNLLN